MANLTRNMHYDYKMKLNKLDSNKYRNLRVPEIDWKLNEAQNLLIRMIAFPRLYQGVGYELNQRSIDDLRTIVKEKESLAVISNSPAFVIELPQDYMHHIASYAVCTKGNCTKTIRTTLVQHDDKFEDDPFSKSSFEWEQANLVFTSQGIIVYSDDFSVTNFLLTYLRKPKYIHSAEDAVNASYILPDGTTLTGYQNCELPEILHPEVVDVAVLITTGDLMPNYEVKQAKLRMTT